MNSKMNREAIRLIVWDILGNYGENGEVGWYLVTKVRKILLIQKKAVPLHAFSAFGLPSSAAEGTDDTIFRYANVEDSASRLTDVTY